MFTYNPMHVGREVRRNMNEVEELRYLVLAAQREGNRMLAQGLRPLGLTPSQAEVETVLHDTISEAFDEDELSGTLAALRRLVAGRRAGEALARRSGLSRLP